MASTELDDGVAQSPRPGVDVTYSNLTDAAPEYSDEQLALRFSERHGNTLQYVAAWGQWFIWQRTHWVPEKTLRVYDLAREICREASAECKTPRTAVAIASAKTVNAVVTLARADRRHAATVDQWDRDPWRLATPHGTVDLRTGVMRAPDCQDYITKCAAVSPDGDCEAWLQFLDRVTNGDLELTAYLRRVAGYCLTGDISEHALFFLYGTGRNGKGTFIDTLLGILGGYGAAAPAETFLASNSERHPTDLASLRGARLVAAHETEPGRRWAEARIKQLTGGDRVTARFMRQDYFEYTPECKILISGNHRPAIRSLDEAMRARMRLVPFPVTIPESERDHRLKQRLREEWPGILAWCIAGCLEWQQHGLKACAAVSDATANYFADEDLIAKWIEECCATDEPDEFTSNSVLFREYREWALRAGEFPGTQRSFNTALAARGFERHRVGAGGIRGFRGIRVVLPGA